VPVEEPTEARQRIWQVIAAIPAGRVSTYGQVAQLAGLGRGARQVGQAMRQLPEGSTIPWHRVINAQGRISLPPGSRGHKRQRERLEAEGIRFNLSGRVSLKQQGWLAEEGSQPE
jgi:methylated-DNA-protein-cysteine methyltransferase-like protein